MKIVVAGADDLFNELTEGSVDITWIKTETSESFILYPDADAYFNLNENAVNEKYSSGIKNIYIHSVTYPLLNNQSNLFRINAWKGFLKRNVWEVSGENNEHPALAALNKKVIRVNNEPGFISARILAMIINEAYFAIGEKVSSEEEIDIALRLGTNYPKGPFEWADEIGRNNVYELLMELSKYDVRYFPAPSFKKHFNLK